MRAKAYQVKNSQIQFDSMCLAIFEVAFCISISSLILFTSFHCTPIARILSDEIPKIRKKRISGLKAIRKLPRV